VADALTTAFMLMGAEEIAGLCARSPGLEAWILRVPQGEPRQETRLVHLGGSAR
jgi:thiamine biosynthesis lipoprotein ApbE